MRVSPGLGFGLGAPSICRRRLTPNPNPKSDPNPDPYPNHMQEEAGGVARAVQQGECHAAIEEAQA